MSARLRLFDLKRSDFTKTNGLCPEDTASVANLANRVQSRLLYCREAQDEGWYGTFSEVRIRGVKRSTPYITLPRTIARIEKLDLCKCPVPIHGQFMEYLNFGNGHMPKLRCYDQWGTINAYQRNTAITFADLPEAPQKLRLYSTDTADAESGARVLIQGTDANGMIIYSYDADRQVQGEFIVFGDTFMDSNNSFKTITGVQKDVTAGQMQLFAVNADGSETELLTMEPSEQVSGYTRYYLSNLPLTCCPPATVTTPSELWITAIAKLEPMPVKVDQDYLIIQNLEAMIEEAHSLRYSEMDNTDAKKEAVYHHAKAVQLLNGELSHYLGLNNPSVVFAPFGSAKLERIGVNMR